MQYQMPTQDSDEDSDIEVMPSARWKFGRREKPYSEPGSILLDASDTTRNALVEAEKLTEPSTSTHPFPRGEIRDPVFWKNIDGGVSKATLCIRKLGPKEPTLSDTVVEDPCDRDVFYAAVRLDGDGIGETEFDPTTTYVTDQGRFEVSMNPGSLQSSLLETSVTALHTGTTYMVRPAGDSVQCVRTRDFQPPDPGSDAAAAIKAEFWHPITHDLPQTVQTRLDEIFESETKDFEEAKKLKETKEREEANQPGTTAWSLPKIELGKKNKRDKEEKKSVTWNLVSESALPKA